MKSIFYTSLTAALFILPNHTIAMDKTIENKKKAENVIDDGITLLNRLQDKKDEATLQEIKVKIESAKLIIAKLPDGSLKDGILAKYKYLNEGMQLYDKASEVVNSAPVQMVEKMVIEHEDEIAGGIANVIKDVTTANTPKEGISNIISDIASATAAEVLEEQQQANSNNQKLRRKGCCTLL